MNKTSKSIASLIAATAVAAGGIALAQSPAATTSSDVPPKTSTPGAGCTATGNAMSAGNLGNTPTGKCDPAAAAATTAVPAAASTTTTTTTESAPAPSASTAPTPDTSMAATTPPPAAAPAAPAPQRVARADRG